jgi:hypothetical protein
MSNTQLPLTDEQLEELVERVTEKVIKNFYTSVGESVVKRITKLIGFGAVALLMWAAGTGHFPGK